MSQQAQLKTTSVILKIDIINSPPPQRKANGATIGEEPIKGGEKVKMVQLKPMQTILATLMVLLVLGAIGYFAINGSSDHKKQQQKENLGSNLDSQLTTTTTGASSAEASKGQLSSISVVLPSLTTATENDAKTTFGRPAIISYEEPKAATAIQEQATSQQQQQQRTSTSSQQEPSASVSVEKGKLFGAPVPALATTQAAQASQNASTEQSVGVGQSTADQPVRILDAEISILLPEQISSTTALPPAVETIPMQSVTTPSEAASSLSPSSSSPPSDAEQAWQEFKSMYKRQYPNQEEELKRRDIFLLNSRFISAHNELKDTTYKLGMNHFGDFTRDEINQLFIGPQISWSQTISHLQTPIPPSIKILSDTIGLGEPQPQVDWRNLTSGSPVDQGTCHESSVFAAVASMEAALNARLSQVPQAPGMTWQPVKLAESQVFDCMRTVAPANAPPICAGYSSMLHVFDLLQRSPLGGLVSLAEYIDFVSQPLNSLQQRCDLPQAAQQPTSNAYDLPVYPQQPRAKLNTFNVIHRDNIAEALLNSGPLVVALDASQSSFHFYKSGLYYDQNCSTDTYNHHALLIGLQPVGQDLLDVGNVRHNIVDSSPPSQYLVRNSLGLDWGEGGHMRLLKVEDNKCLPQMLAISPNLL